MAIEVELTTKAPRRLRSIMRLYAGAGHLAGVRYYVTNAETKRAIERAIEREDVNEFEDDFAVLRSIAKFGRS